MRIFKNLYYGFKYRHQIKEQDYFLLGKQQLKIICGIQKEFVGCKSFKEFSVPFKKLIDYHISPQSTLHFGAFRYMHKIYDLAEKFGGALIKKDLYSGTPSKEIGISMDTLKVYPKF